MEYKDFKDHVVIRLDPNDEIIASITKVATDLGIALGSVSAIGAVKKISVGLFLTEEKRYVSNTFTGDFEITALVGNITKMNDKAYLHLHLTAADEKARTYGGHLTEAIVSATCEIFIAKINGETDRRFDPDIGLNILKF